MTTPLRTLIVDDERLARKRLRSLLADHASVEVVGEAGDLDEACRLVREKMVALEETRMLKEAVVSCFRGEGVNAAEHCQPLVEAYAAKLAAPQYGMLSVSWM